MIINADAIFELVYSDSSPFIEKIQTFENFFTKRIDLYDKVRFLYHKAISPPLYVILLSGIFEVLIIVMTDTGLLWSSSQLATLAVWTLASYLLCASIFSSIIRG